ISTLLVFSISAPPVCLSRLHTSPPSHCTKLLSRPILCCQHATPPQCLPQISPHTSSQTASLASSLRPPSSPLSSPRQNHTLHRARWPASSSAKPALARLVLPRPSTPSSLTVASHPSTS